MSVTSLAYQSSSSFGTSGKSPWMVFIYFWTRKCVFGILSWPMNIFKVASFLQSGIWTAHECKYDSNCLSNSRSLTVLTAPPQQPPALGSSHGGKEGTFCTPVPLPVKPADLAASDSAVRLAWNSLNFAYDFKRNTSSCRRAMFATEATLNSLCGVILPAGRHRIKKYV